MAGLAGCRAATTRGVDPNDKRAAALQCISEEKGIDARLAGNDRIQVGDADTGPRIRFFLTGGEAEAEQFEGRGEGAEQIRTPCCSSARGEDLGEIELPRLEQ